MRSTKRLPATARYILDAWMTAALLALMAYERIGQATHEWVGVLLFVLFAGHHFLNRRWWPGLRGGRWNAFRALQTLLALLALAAMLCPIVSGVWLSQTVFTWLPISGGRSTARTIHMLAAYWGYVVMGLHLGLHGGGILAALRRTAHRPAASGFGKWVLRLLGFALAGYGAAAFVRRGLPDYLFLRTHFAFFDYEEPLALFFADYAAILALFVLAGYWLGRAAQRASAPKGGNRVKI